MARATHLIRSRLFHHGEWREPGTTIDASAWPTRQELEGSGDLVPLPPEKQVEISDKVGSPPPARTSTKPKAPRSRRAGKESGGEPASLPSAEPGAPAPDPPVPAGKAKRGKRR